MREITVPQDTLWSRACLLKNQETLFGVLIWPEVRSGQAVSCTSSHGHMQHSLTLPALHSLYLQPWETGPIDQYWKTNWNEAQALAIKVITVCIRPPRPLYALYKPGYVFVSSFPCFTPSLKNTWQRPECLQLQVIDLRTSISLSSSHTDFPYVP